MGVDTLIKIGLFAVFVVVLGAFITFTVELVSPYIANIQLLSFAAWLGVLDALMVYITIVVAGWLSKQAIGYFKNL